MNGQQESQIGQVQTTVCAPTWLVILLLVFFSPAAWYFMWKEKRYHSWFPILLWIYGGIILIVSSLQLFVVIPKLSTLYQEFNVPQNPRSFSQGFLVVLMIFALIQIGFGIFLKNKIKATDELPKNLMWITIAIFVLDYLPLVSFSGIGIMISVLLPIYKLTSSF